MLLNRRKYKRYAGGGPIYNLNGDLVSTGEATLTDPAQRGIPQFSETDLYTQQQQQTIGKVGSSIGGNVGAQVGIWGELSKVGESVGADTRGNQEDTTKNYIGNWQTPTHTNVLDAVNNGNTEEVLDNVFFGGLFGTKGKRQKKEAIDARYSANREEFKYRDEEGKARLLGYDSKGSNEQASLYKTGGQLKPLNSDTVEVDGATHAEGGVKLPTIGAEVEDNETISGGYVFSDFLGFADKHKTLAKQIGKIEKKPMSNSVRTSLFLLRGKEERLKQEQESLKSQLGLGTGEEMAFGGQLDSLVQGMNPPATDPSRIWADNVDLYIDDAGNLQERSPSQKLNLRPHQRKNAERLEFNNTFGYLPNQLKDPNAAGIPGYDPLRPYPKTLMSSSKYRLFN